MTHSSLWPNLPYLLALGLILLFVLQPSRQLGLTRS